MITFVAFHAHYRPELGRYLAASQICQKKSMLAQFRRVAANGIDYQTMLKILFRSIDLTHPVNEKVLLTDDMSSFSWPEPLGVDVIRKKIDVTRLMLSRLRAQLAFLRDCSDQSHYVFVDSDMIVNRNLSPVFSQTFDVGLTYRTKHPMPINGGLILVHRDRLLRAREAFAEMLEIYENRYPDHDVWWGDQLALRDMLDLRSEDVLREGIVPGLPYEILLLDTETYNYSATGMDILAHAPDKYVLHFKSWHKDFMASYWKRWVLGRRCASFAFDTLRLRSAVCKRELRRVASLFYHRMVPR